MAMQTIDHREVQRLAKRKGWSIADVARIAKVTERQARRWLRGDSNPTEAPMMRLRAAS